MKISIGPEIPLLRGPVAFSHLLMRTFVRPGDKVVDATCGNGNDTLLLAELAGPKGHVWGFDIQPRAIAESARKLTEAGLYQRVILLHSGHQHLSSHLVVPLQLVMFNLGYLPGGDRALITTPETTLAALRQALELLVPGGAIIVTIYPGHNGGSAEQQAVDAWAAALDPKSCHSWRIGQQNVAADAPYCLLVQKAS